MLLSIVECGNHKHYKNSHSVAIPVVKVSDQVERIGPVVGPSISHMRNWGAQNAKGQWFFFKDQDCEIDLKKILSLIERLERQKNPVVAVSGIYRNVSQGGLAKTYGEIQRKWVHRGLMTERLSGLVMGQHLLGGALLLKSEAFQEINGFCEKIGWGSEELDLAQRLQSKGYKTAVSFNLKVAHNNPLRWRGFLRRAWKQNFNRAFYQLSLEQTSPRLEKSYIYRPRSRSQIFSTGLFFATALLAEKGGRLMRNFEGSRH